MSDFPFTPEKVGNFCSECSVFGHLAFDGTDVRYRYAKFWDYDCCYFGSLTPDGYIVVDYINGPAESVPGTVIESTNNMPMVFPVGSNRGAFGGGVVRSATLMNGFAYNGGCCNGDGTAIFVELSEMI